MVRKLGFSLTEFKPSDFEAEYQSLQQNPDKYKKAQETIGSIPRKMENFAIGAGRRPFRLIESGVNNLAKLGELTSGIETEYQMSLDPVINAAGLGDKTLVTGIDEKAQQAGGKAFDMGLGMAVGGVVNSSIPMGQMGKARNLWDAAAREGLQGLPYAFTQQGIRLADTGKINPQEMTKEVLTDMLIGAGLNVAGKGVKAIKNSIGKLDESGKINFDAFRPTKKSDQLEKILKDEFGFTKDPEVAAYITPSGKFIDGGTFKQARVGEGKNRLIDHDTIAAYASRTKEELLEDGFIRVDSGGLGGGMSVHMVQEPNAEQIKGLEDIFKVSKDKLDASKAEGLITSDKNAVFLDVTDNKGNIIKSETLSSFEELLENMGGKVDDIAEGVGKTDLLSEAKKAISENKSADEFIKGQGVPLFRGQDQPEFSLGPRADRLIKGTEGSPFSRTPESASNYANGPKATTIEAYIPKDVILTAKDLPQDIRTSLNNDINKLTYDDYVEGEGFEEVVSKILPYAEQRGKQAVDLSTFFPADNIDAEVRVLDTATSLKTKAQLTDIYNKAKGTGVGDIHKFLADSLGGTAGKNKTGFQDTIKVGDNKVTYQISKHMDNQIHMRMIEADSKGTGLGSKFMESLKKYSDDTGKPIVISSARNRGFFDKFNWLKSDAVGSESYRYSPNDIYNKAKGVKKYLLN